ncbi:PAS domain-containing sensor histidine kinase [Roseivirga echinicomitans]|uniref:histidine kinase n=1 Tax=Roseivirga echinicomitans TaxID=296218 RepID=A0A150X288_9BACT|nr:PAS domain-containing sensor histidine kinase [Roseivirga echinicomitans]KYG72835.1 PAS domain-containing sensor histidine kinase [Roseivirga echinicomitans]
MNDKPTYEALENQIAELKKQNEALRLHTSSQSEVETKESREYIHAILNNMGDAVFVKNNKSKLILVNDAFCELFGLSRTQIIGKTLAENVSPDERKSFLKIDKKVLSSGLENISEESLTVDGGQTHIISTRKSRFIDASGEKFIVGVIRDISEHQKAEAALKESEARLRALNTTKDKLFSIIAHDLRGPFYNIIGVSQLLINEVKDTENEATQKPIDMINSIAKNTFSLLDNLLNWARTQSGELNLVPEKIILPVLIHEIIELNKPLARAKDITLNYTLTDDIELYTDENILRTVLRNLISNAIKFTHLGGNVNISANIKNHQVEVAVADSGVGMNQETLNKLFNLSTNATLPGTAREKGSGLGLVLCKEFVKKLNGDIWAESEVGKGSTFIFNLPLSA